MCNRWLFLLALTSIATLKVVSMDVSAMLPLSENAWRQSAESTPINTVILTVSNSSDINASASIEAENLWPTYDNIIAEIDDITQKATKGDFVYIHYSGHGTQIPTTIASDNNTKLKGDFALVLVDRVHRGGYLHVAT